MCVCMNVCRGLKRPEEGVRFPEAGGKGGLLWFDQGRFLKSWDTTWVILGSCKFSFHN